MWPATGLGLGTLRRRLFFLLAAASVIAILGVNLIWLPGTVRDVHDARAELQLVAVRGVRDQIDLFLADKEEGLRTVAQLFRAALLDGDPNGVALVAQRFLQREKTFEEIGVFDTRSTWRYRLSRREVVSNAVKYSPTGGDIGVRLTREQGVVRWQIQDTGIGIPKESQRDRWDRPRPLPGPVDRRAARRSRLV